MDPTLVETRSDEPVTAKVPVVEELKGYVTGNSHRNDGNNLDVHHSQQVVKKHSKPRLM
jgi:hypothetical protein